MQLFSLLQRIVFITFKIKDMKKTILILTLFLFTSVIVFSQNYIQNHSFEDSTAANQSSFATFPFWSFPTSFGMDVYHPNGQSGSQVPSNNNGTQQAKEGTNYSVIYGYDTTVTDYRGYFQNELKDSLLKDSTYCFQMYVSLTESSLIALKNSFGVYLTKSKLSFTNKFNRINQIPQIILDDTIFLDDKSNWVKLSGSFIANGGENYATIGVFKASNLLDTLQVGNLAQYPIPNEHAIYYFDDVFLGDCDSLPRDTGFVGLVERQMDDYNIFVYPNPVMQSFTLAIVEEVMPNYQLYNAMGQQFPLKAEKVNNGFRFDAQHLPKGIYVLRLVGEKARSVKLIKE